MSNWLPVGQIRQAIPSFGFACGPCHATVLCLGLSQVNKTFIVLFKFQRVT